MPTYEYACSGCGHQFEEFQSIKAKPITVCPKCKKRKVKRLISSGAGFIFKGSGFYETDYRSESYKAAAKSEAGGGKTETKTEGAKAEAAPAKAEGAKSETKAAASPKSDAKSAGSASKK
jgi:putative FmdB family regulatory protein